MVAAEHQRGETVTAGSLDLVCDPRAGLQDLVRNRALSVPVSRVSAIATWTFPRSSTSIPAPSRPLAEARVADRRGPHVDARGPAPRSTPLR
jgi:hypothetical protein